jgi:putative transcriptional regulator
MNGKITRVSVADLNNLPDGTDWERIAAMTDEEAEANALSDPDNPPMTEEQLRGMRRISPAKHVRFRLMLTQEEFSARYHIPLGTLRDWEQHRSEPDQASRAYLKVIAKDPDLVAAALADGKPAAAAE